MQIQFVPSLMAIAAVFSAMVAAAPVESANVVVINDSAAPVLKRSKNSNGDDDKSYSGTATWYSPKKNGGTQAACGGKKISDDSEIVALNAPQYGKMSKDSDWCGKEIEITGPKGTTKATILDACPECSHGDLDLTPVLFERVCGSKNKGVADITWKLV
ncbi:expansin family protein [Mucor ambiguus]|uniref:Expansin family protein n=1 Tax=Mucor ambiguus TaxID=91626 RepID=A0A0C9MLN5_9FUNG|nr:expansin family protein [Mucor ambiguus]